MKKLILLAALASAIAAFSCQSVDDTRIPATAVYLPFTDAGVWAVYGVSGALDAHSFVKSERIPTGYPYTELSATGFGGILLVGDFDGNPVAYDLACPVEVKPSVRVGIDRDQSVAVCPVCGSTYDVFRLGHPLSGPAAESGYALARYRVGPSQSGVYMAVTL